MKFHKTAIDDVILIETIPAGDARGHFVRTFCAREMKEHGVNLELAQTSQSFNAKKGTLRGLHFQAAPMMEDKLVRCLNGAIFDVMVDLRPNSSTFLKWVGYELTAENNRQLFAPQGFAHGFQTLTNNCAVSYGIGQFYDANLSAGVRFDDPDIGVEWPLPPVELSPRDLGLPYARALDHQRLMGYPEPAA
jgi:dTDP-4-dehydrorhamnose 3,5-epimerase